MAFRTFICWRLKLPASWLNLLIFMRKTLMLLCWSHIALLVLKAYTLMAKEAIALSLVLKLSGGEVILK